MNKMNLLMLVMLAAALTSCKPKVAGVEPAPVVSVEGIWSTDCMADLSDSYIETLQVENSTMTYAKIFFSDTRICDPTKRQATLMKSGSITIASGTASIAEGKNFEWQLSAVMAVPESDDLVTMLNRDSACGSNAWVKNQGGLIFACAVSGGFDLTRVMPNAIDYGVFVIKASATPNSLQFGSKCATAGYDGLCPTADARATSLDGTVYYRR